MAGKEKKSFLYTWQILYDENKVWALRNIAEYYVFNDPDLGIM